MNAPSIVFNPAQENVIAYILVLHVSLLMVLSQKRLLFPKFYLKSDLVTKAWIIQWSSKKENIIAQH